MTEHDFCITKRNVHAKFQANLPKNVEARLNKKKPTKKIGENQLKKYDPIFGFFWLTNLTKVFIKDTFVQNLKKIG